MVGRVDEWNGYGMRMNKAHTCNVINCILLTPNTCLKPVCQTVLTKKNASVDKKAPAFTWEISAEEKEGRKQGFAHLGVSKLK